MGNKGKLVKGRSDEIIKIETATTNSEVSNLMDFAGFKNVTYIKNPIYHF